MKMFLSILTVLIISIGGGFMAVAFTDTASAELFLKANKAYQDGNYEQAIQKYQQLENIRNGHLYYNLGNAYFKVDQKGKAIASYLKAQKLLPRDEDLRANLLFVRKKAGSLETTPVFWQRLFFWHSFINLKESLWLFLSLWIIMCIIFLLQQNFASPALKSPSRFLLILVILSSLAPLEKIYQHNLKQGVIIVKKSEVKTGTSAANITLFTLPEGSLVKIEEIRNDWCKIKFSQDKRGWLPLNSLEVI